MALFGVGDLDVAKGNVLNWNWKERSQLNLSVPFDATALNFRASKIQLAAKNNKNKFKKLFNNDFFK